MSAAPPAGDHPRPEQLEADSLPPEVAAHLERCPACRVDRRLLRRGRQPPADLPGAEQARLALDQVRELGSSSLGLTWRSSLSQHDAPLDERRPRRATHLLPAGTVVGPYRLCSLLGRGGMATVYRAEPVDGGPAVALKVLDHPAEDVRRRMHREGRVQQALDHPGIVRVLDTVEADGHFALVLELVEGPSLDRVLRDRRLPLASADALARDILEAVAAAHRAQLVHRDLKPANVLLAPADGGLRARVTDFGLARVQGSALADSVRTRTGAVMGSPAYMAPEQLQGQRDLDARVDVFALGVLLYELVSGLRCFAGLDLADGVQRTLDGRYAPLRDVVPELPESMTRAIEAALQTDRADRPADAGALLQLWGSEARSPWDPDLAAQLLGLAEERVLPTPDAPRATAPRGGRWPVWIGGAVALGLLALGARALLAPRELASIDVVHRVDHERAGTRIYGTVLTVGSGLAAAGEPAPLNAAACLAGEQACVSAWPGADLRAPGAADPADRVADTGPWLVVAGLQVPRSQQTPGLYEALASSTPGGSLPLSDPWSGEPLAAELATPEPLALQAVPQVRPGQPLDLRWTPGGPGQPYVELHPGGLLLLEDDGAHQLSLEGAQAVSIGRLSWVELRGSRGRLLATARSEQRIAVLASPADPP